MGHSAEFPGDNVQVPVTAHAPERWVGPSLSLLALVLYSRTVAPSLGGTVDSPEFQHAAYSMAVAHPTGYPIYLLLGKLWITLFPVGDVAYRMNLLSAIFAALAVWVLYALVRQVTSSVPAGIAAAGLFAVQGIPWSQAGVAEINTLNTLLVGLAFASVVLWSRARLPLPVVALVLGLAASHHRTFLLYVIPLAIYAVVALRSGRAPHIRLSHLALSAVLALLPFAAYVYLPLRAFTTPWYSNTWEGFLQHIAGDSALPAIERGISHSLLQHLRLVLADQMFRGLGGGTFLGLGLLGVAVLLFTLVRRRNSPAQDAQANAPGFYPGGLALGPVVLCAVAFLLGTGFAAAYDIVDIYDYLSVPTFMWSVLAGVGFLGLLRLIARATSRLEVRRTQVSRIVAVGLLILVAALLCGVTAIDSLARRDIRVDYSKLDRRGYWATVMQTLGDAPPGTILVGDWYELNEALYFQRVEGWRPDFIAVPLDSVTPADDAQLDIWLKERRQVYLLGQYGPVMGRFETAVRGPVTFGSEVRGPLWQLLGRKAEQAAPEMVHRVDRRFGSSIVLIGYTLQPANGLKPGDVLRVTLFWKATERVYERYTIFNHVLNADGIKVGQKDDEPQRGFEPTILWQPDETVVDTMEMPISADAKLGSYRLITGMYNSVTHDRLPAYGPDGAPLGDYAALAAITIEAP